MSELGGKIGNMFKWMRPSGLGRMDMPASASPPSMPEQPVRERTAMDIIADGINRASRAAGNNCIVDVHGVSLTQEEIAAGYARVYGARILTLDQLKEAMPPRPERSTTYVITGYDPADIRTDRGREFDTQGRIRAVSFYTDRNGIRSNVILLSDGVPDPQAFDRDTCQWLNGPFSWAADGILSLQTTDDGQVFELIAHELHRGNGQTPDYWTQKQPKRLE